MTGSSEVPRVDLRLLPSVIAAWIAAWLTPTLSDRLALSMVALLLAVCVVQRRRAIVWVACLMAAGITCSMLIRIGLHEHGPIAELAAQRRDVTVVGTLTTDPRWTDRVGFGGAAARGMMVDLRVTQVSVPEHSWKVRTPVVVMGDATGWDELKFGATVKLEGSLQPSDGLTPEAAVLFARGPPGLVEQPSVLLQGAERMRSGLRDAVSGAPPDVRGLLPALVVGDTSELSPTLVDDLRTSGLAHLTAVSGANVAIVLMAVLLIARYVRVRGYALPVVGLLAVGWFVLLARPQPSVLRAAVMGALAVVAVAATGRRNGPRLLLAAVLLLLVVDPWLARSWGFALSVAATAGLLGLAGRWASKLSLRMPRAIAEGLAVALAAQLATLPLTVALSGQVALLAVPANLLAAPAVAPATVLGAGAAAVSPAAPWLANVLTWLAQWPTAWIAFVAHRAANSSLATVPWPSGWVGAGAALLMLIGGVIGVRAVFKHRLLRGCRGWLALAVALSIAIAFVNGPGRWPPPGWLLVVCDVGQGDAIVVSAGHGSALVVDTGPDPVLVDRCLDQLDVDRIPLLVLTHDHADHVMGVPAVLDGRSVGTVLVSPLNEPVEQADLVAEWTQGLNVVTAEVGQSGQIGPIQWQVLWPARVIRGEGSDPNNASVVLMVEVGGVRVLLTGDVEPAAQRALTESGADLRAEIIKVPHHGSPNQYPGFWQAVNPDLALVSVGIDNTYGHPDEELLQSLAAAGVTVGRTDIQGALAVVGTTGQLRLVTRFTR
ncbi:MAG TPA: ComEC/Rec2 family competence protein [Actinomycetes bacterium]|nr:ComEC/Rec2 family competence protein [Actinomycetes bacterium]